MENISNFSLENQIKNVIGTRVLFCAFLLMILVVGLTIYDISKSTKEMQAHVSERIKPLEDFTIGQMILNNYSSVEVKLDAFNKANKEFQIEWKPDNLSDYNQFTWQFPYTTWTYNYKLGNIAGYQFGYYKIKGSVFASTVLYYNFLIRLGWLILFTFFVMIFLYPLAKKIPQKLFVDPINRFIDLFSKHTGDKNLALGKLPIELEDLELKIMGLLDQEKEYQENKASIEIGKMSAKVAHDIRSPLAALNAIVKQTQNIPERQRIMIRNATQQINDIANNLLEQYRTDKQNSNGLNPEIVFLLLDTAISEKRAQYADSIAKIEFTIAPDSYGLFCNVCAVDFKRVISNLINNAVEAIKQEGKINLHLSHENNWVKLSLNDNGLGMPQEIIQKVLQGENISNKKEGHGIGLSSAKNMIENWGGKLFITSTANIGTTIDITLPLVEPAKWFSDKLTFTNNSTVVILDDDQSIHDVWESRFETEIPQANLILKHYYHPQELLTTAPYNNDVQLYLCDYELIGHTLSGLDVIEKLGLKNTRSVLVTSRYDDPDIRARCKKIGIKILPKSYAIYVPLIVETTIQSKELNSPASNTKQTFSHVDNTTSTEPDLILIDDNKTLTDTWKITAEFSDKNIVVFNSTKEAENEIHHYSTHIAIYVDSDLGENIKGEEYAKSLYERGYRNIYLTTGYEASTFDLNKFYWIKNVVGKEPQFD
jgi:signal transduction histidine kinase